jgi:uncharacterized protein YjdB
VTLEGNTKGIETVIARAQDGSGIYGEKAIEVAVRINNITANMLDTILEGSSHKLSPTVGPVGAEADSFAYSFYTWDGTNLSLFNDPSFITISENGTIEVKEQTAEFDQTLYLKIEAFDKFGNGATKFGISESPKFVFTNKIDQILISKDKDTIYVGDTVKVTATIEPSYADDQTITWTTPNSTQIDILNPKVNPGYAKGLKKGNVTITAIANDKGGATKSVDVTVLQQMYDFKIPDYNKVYTDETVNYFIYGIVPNDANVTDVVWELYEIDGTTPVTDANFGSISSGGEFTPGMLGANSQMIVRCISDDKFKVTVEDTINICQKVTEIQITGASRIPVGFNESYTFTVLPNNATDKSIRISASQNVNTTKTDNFNYTLTGVKAGFIDLIARANDISNVSATKRIEVYEPITDISSVLSGNPLYLYINQTKQIIAKTEPLITNTSLSYSLIDGAQYASLSGSSVTGKQVGIAKVEITANDILQTKDTIDVNVIRPIDSIKIVPILNMEVGQIEKLNVNIYPEDATIKDLNYFRSNQNIVIDNEGNITAAKEGYVNVTVSTNDGTNLSDEIRIYIYRPVIGFQIDVKKIDRIFLSNGNLPVIDGRRVVTKDSIEIHFKTYPDNATDRSMNFELTNNDKVSMSSQPVEVGYDLVNYYALELTGDYVKVQANDPRGTRDSIFIETVKWIEEIKLTDERNVVPIYGNLYVAPNILDGILPQDASNKRILYSVDSSEYATIDSYGMLTAKGDLGFVNVRAIATDGSKTTDSLRVEIRNPDIEVKLKNNKTSLPVNFKEQLIVSTFPENLDYELSVIDSLGTIDSEEKVSSPNIGEITVVAKSRYLNIDIFDTLSIEIANKTLFITTKDVLMRINDELNIDYINYANEVYWTIDTTSIKDSIISLEGDGFITGLNYGKAVVYAENEIGSKDSANVTVILNTIDINTGILVYPNPNTNKWLNVQLKNLEGEIKYTVHDVNGNLIMESTSKYRAFRTPLPENTTSGRYLFTATDELGNSERNWFVVILE